MADFAPGRLAGCTIDEIAALPLRHHRLLALNLVGEFQLAGDGVERPGPQMLDHLLAVEADLLDRLFQRLRAGVGDRAAPAVGLVLGHFLERVEIGLRARCAAVPAAGAEDALCLVAELCLVSRERRTDGGVKHLGIIAQGLRLARDHESVARIAERHETVGAAVLGLLHLVREVARGHRIGLAQTTSKPASLKPCCRRR